MVERNYSYDSDDQRRGARLRHAATGNSMDIEFGKTFVGMLMRAAAVQRVASVN